MRAPHYSRFRARLPKSIITHLVKELEDLACLCGKRKNRLHRSEQWVTVTSLEGEDFLNFEWCQICSDDPHFHLVLLACTDIGDEP